LLHLVGSSVLLYLIYKPVYYCEELSAHDGSCNACFETAYSAQHPLVSVAANRLDPSANPSTYFPYISQHLEPQNWIRNCISWILLRNVYVNES